MAVKPPSPSELAERKHNRNTDWARSCVFEHKYGSKRPVNWPVVVKENKNCPMVDKISRWL